MDGKLIGTFGSLALFFKIHRTTTQTKLPQLIACFHFSCANQENSEERPVSVNKQRLGAMGDRPARPSLIEQVLNQKRLVSHYCTDGLMVQLQFRGELQEKKQIIFVRINASTAVCVACHMFFINFILIKLQ